MLDRAMRVHVLGVRGLPSSYSGYETFVAELAPRLVERGHEVTVYCRRSLFEDRPPVWKGVRLRYLPSLEHKAFSTLSHSCLAMVAAVRTRPDAILAVNAATGWFSILPCLFRVPHAINVDGMEWARPKWSGLGRAMFRAGARLACRFADVVITDADEMHRLYVREFGIDSVYIAYGANLEDTRDPSVVRSLGLEPGRYFLIASRLIPDNNADVILEAFRGVQTDVLLAVAGGADYRGNAVERQFMDTLRRRADGRVRFLGHIGDPDVVRELHCNCFAYVHGHQFGGINPSLLKALGCGNMVLALNTPFNAEVLDGGCFGVMFERDAGDLRDKMQALCDHPETAAAFRARARDRIRERFSWDRIADQYERVLDAVSRRVPRREIHV